MVCGPTCTVAHFRGLTPGTTYETEVYRWNSDGYSAEAVSNSVTLSDTCPQSSCLTIATTTGGTTVGGGDNGLLDAVFPEQGEDDSALTKLQTHTFRGAPGVDSDGTFDWHDWYQIAATGAHMDLELCMIWQAEGQKYTTASAYEQWVESTVRTVVASGQQVNSIEPMNEPNGYESISDLETQFQAAYQGIEAADPSAAIIGPSFSRLTTYADEYGTKDEPVMSDFLAWANGQHMKLAAVSWHEIADYLGPLPTENTLSPENLIDNVDAARALIAKYPNLGSPQVWINEYGMPEISDSAGWDVRYLAALETAGVQVAGLSCWDVHCANPDLDGLLTINGAAPTSAYWVYQAYGTMTGTLDPTTSTDGTTAVLASTANGTTTALIGRGQSCVDNSFNNYCKNDWNSPPPGHSHPSPDLHPRPVLVDHRRRHPHRSGLGHRHGLHPLHAGQHHRHGDPGRAHRDHPGHQRRRGIQADRHAGELTGSPGSLDGAGARGEAERGGSRREAGRGLVPRPIRVTGERWRTQNPARAGPGRGRARFASADPLILRPIRVTGERWRTQNSRDGPAAAQPPPSRHPRRPLVRPGREGAEPVASADPLILRPLRVTGERWRTQNARPEPGRTSRRQPPPSRQPQPPDPPRPPASPPAAGQARTSRVVKRAQAARPNTAT